MPRDLSGPALPAPTSIGPTMTESYELRDLDGLGRQEHVDDQREHLLRKTSDEILQEEIRQLQGGLDGVEPYLPRKSTDSTGDRDDDMEEMINRVSF